MPVPIKPWEPGSGENLDLGLWLYDNTMFLEVTWAVDLYEALSEPSLKPTHSHLRGSPRLSIHSWSHPLGDRGL